MKAKRKLGSHWSLEAYKDAKKRGLPEALDRALASLRARSLKRSRAGKEFIDTLQKASEVIYRNTRKGIMKVYVDLSTPLGRKIAKLLLSLGRGKGKIS